jgi:hypothetical protein
MRLRNCIFLAGNARSLIYTEEERVDLDYYYFSGSVPDNRYATFGDFDSSISTSHEPVRAIWESRNNYVRYFVIWNSATIRMAGCEVMISGSDSRMEYLIMVQLIDFTTVFTEL